jgi:hypothetical protein
MFVFKRKKPNPIREFFIQLFDKDAHKKAKKKYLKNLDKTAKKHLKRTKRGLKKWGKR